MGLNGEEVKNIINKINNSTVNVLSIIGGEPLLRKDIVEIIDLLSDKIKIKLDTNGVMLKKKWNDAFEKIYSFNIGLDGNVLSNELQRKNTSKVIESIEFLKNKNKNISLTYLLSNENFKYFDDSILFLNSLNIDSITINNFAPIYSYNKGFFNTHLKLDDQQTKSFINKIKIIENQNQGLYSKLSFSGFMHPYFLRKSESTGSCYCGVYKASISPDGYLLPCLVLSNNSNYKIFDDFIEENNLLLNSIEQIQKESSLFKLYKKSIFNYPSQCVNCVFQNSNCYGGCRSYGILEERSIEIKNVHNCNLNITSMIKKNDDGYYLIIKNKKILFQYDQDRRSIKIKSKLSKKYFIDNIEKIILELKECLGITIFIIEMPFLIRNDVFNRKFHLNVSMSTKNIVAVQSLHKVTTEEKITNEHHVFFKSVFESEINNDYKNWLNDFIKINKKSTILTIRKNNTLLGVLLTFELSENLEYIFLLGTLIDKRNNGIGKSLMSTLFAYMPNKKFVLNTVNTSNAYFFYKRIGFNDDYINSIQVV